MQPFEPAKIGRVELSNRLFRSATFEGMCDANGTPMQTYVTHYGELATQGLGAIITGFMYVSLDGRAAQPGQAGLEHDGKIAAFAQMTKRAHESGGRIFAQLAHAGRQTLVSATNGEVYGASRERSRYFRNRVRPLSTEQAAEVARHFGAAARRAQNAGFDGVQVHAAHGYLVHQFINPVVNDRSDLYGVDPDRGIGVQFLREVLRDIRGRCGADFPVLVKISSGDNYYARNQQREFIELVRFLDEQAVDAIEVSFGTMDQAFNIFRGCSIPVDAILDHNWRYRTGNRFKRWCWRKVVLPALHREVEPFSPMYNLPATLLARRYTRRPLIAVGGFRTGAQIRRAISEMGIEFVSLCRPLICEPDFVCKLHEDPNRRSQCVNCNQCAVMCDTGQPTRCYAPPRPKSANDFDPLQTELKCGVTL